MYLIFRQFNYTIYYQFTLRANTNNLIEIGYKFMIGLKLIVKFTEPSACPESYLKKT